MTLLEKLFAAANAVKAGESLKNPEKWQSAQALSVPIGIILLTALNFAGIPVTDAQLNIMDFGLGTLGFMLHGYLTVATHEHLGLPVGSLANPGTE